MKRKSGSLTARRARAGYVFTLPLILGFVFLFLLPMIYSVIYSFHKLSMSSSDGLVMEFVAWDNYKEAFLGDTDYIPQVFGSLGDLLINGPLILVFSFFIANLLNTRFIGRTFCRAVFFLPVVVTSGVVMLMQDDSLMSSTNVILSTGTESTQTLQITEAVWMELRGLRLDSRLIEFVSIAVERMYDITTASGVQILVFLAGLQTISPSLYEASAIEGATGWENLWKITLPMLSPIVLVNAVYTVIDSMGSLTNPVINRLYTVAWKNNELGYSAAMGWIYYILMFVCVGLVMLIISRFVYYEND